MPSPATTADVPPLLRKSEVPVLTARRLNNVIFVPPEQYGHLQRGGSLHGYLDRDLRRLARARAVLDAKKYPHGVIVRDKEVFPDEWETVRAHEMGHAQIRREGGLSGFNQGPLRTLGHVLSTLSIPAAIVTGTATGRPGLAAAVGAGGMALGALPMLINEHQAHARGREFTPRYSEALKRRALTSYYGGSLLSAALAAAFGGAFGQMSKSASAISNMTLGEVVRKVREQLPNFHAQEAGAGGLAGLLGAYLYHKGKGWIGKEQFRNPEHERLALLKRMAVGGLVGAGGANLVADRLRRYVSNIPLPFGYETKPLLEQMRKEGWKGFRRGALEDRYIDGSSTEGKDPHILMRRELMRRGFNVHTEDPAKDFFKVTGRSPEGADVLGLADRMFDAQHKLRPEYKSTWVDLKPYSLYTDSEKQFSNTPTGVAQPVEGNVFAHFTARPFGESLQLFDKWDFDLHDHEKSELKNLLKAYAEKLWANPYSVLQPDRRSQEKEDIDRIKSLLARQFADSTFARNMPVFHQTFHVPGLGSEEAAKATPHRIPLYGEKSK